MLRSIVALLALVPLIASAMTFNISTLYPDGTSVVNALRDAGKQIDEATEGRVKLRLYPGGVMGDDRAVERRIRTGQLHGQFAQGGAFASAYKDSQVLNLPLSFRDYDEVDVVRAELDEEIREGYASGGWETFGLMDGGFAYLMSRQPIASVEDLRAQKVWIPSNDTASARAARAFRVSPISLNLGSVMTSLQTGAIDAFAAPPVAALTLQWSARVDYLTDMPLLYTFGTLGIHQRHFQRISDADQKVVREVLTATMAELDTSARQDNIRALTAVQNQGLDMVSPSEAELAVWRENADHATAALVSDNQLSQEIVDRFNAILARHRGEHD